MSQKPEHFDVVVVGFGPSGAVASCMLGSRGIKTLAIDRQKDVYDKPRAIAIDHEILRHMDNLGIADEILPYTAPFPASQHFGAKGQLIRRIDMISEPYPLGYTPTMVFSQPPVEAIMRKRAEAYETVDVALGTELISLEQDADEVRLHLKDVNGDARHVTAKYVIACDGASSGVRQSLGLTLEDLVFDEPWLVVDVMVNDASLDKLPQTAAQYCDPARPTTFIIGPGNHRRWEIMLLPGEDPRESEKPDNVWKLLARWLTPEDATLWRAASYRFHALVAADWRRGRVLLAGDAAHQQPPFIGQGMCQGLRDVSNLIWKLDRILKGQSSDALLDSYGVERKRHVRELTGRIKAIGHVICERDPDLAAARDERILSEGNGTPRTITRQEIVPPLQEGLMTAQEDSARGTLFPQPWIVDEDGPHRLDTLTGAGWRLVVDGRADLAGLEDAAPVDGLPITLVRIGKDAAPGVLMERDGVMADWFDRHDRHAALVRPDHYVFGTANTAAEVQSLLSELKTALA
jgi:3-(3-hydroxy-phenyl)propionate hydroxylase